MPRTKKADANAPVINTTKKTNSTSSSTKTTAAQMRNYSKEEYRKELFAKASQAMQLLNLQKQRHEVILFIVKKIFVLICRIHSQMKIDFVI